MLLFLGLLSELFGDSLVRVAFYLTKPESLIQPGDVSAQVGAVIKHPDQEAYAWRFADDPLLVHAEASEHTLDAILEALIQAGVIPGSELAATQARILAARGTMATILDIMPPELAQIVKNYEEMRAAGWFPDPDGGPIS